MTTADVCFAVSVILGGSALAVLVWLAVHAVLGDGQ